MRPGPPDLIRVGRRDGFRPAIAAVVVVAVLLAVAVWKPWETGRGGPAQPTLPPDVGGGLIPAITERPADSVAPDVTPSPSAPTFSGLDLSLMGVFDPHDAWGVAVAYVSQIQLDDARFGGAPFVTPVVSWELIEPGHPTPGPVLDHPAVISVAVAATWPSDVQPGAVHLFTFGPVRPTRSGQASPRPTLGSEVRLPGSIEQLLHESAGDPSRRGVRSAISSCRHRSRATLQHGPTTAGRLVAMRSSSTSAAAARSACPSSSRPRPPADQASSQVVGSAIVWVGAGRHERPVDEEMVMGDKTPKRPPKPKKPKAPTA